MALFDKIKNMVGTEREYDDDAMYPMTDDRDYRAPVVPSRPTPGSMSLTSTAIEMKVVRPERFEDGNQIADHLLSGRTVVINLEAANKETARRMLDFLSGVAYSIDGQFLRVANNTFVITPRNVAVSSDQLSSGRSREESVTMQRPPVDLTSDTLF
ncbi:MAG: cell division protein SepF [Ruminococcus sp.]|nr:cell division protein SepF [Candidatus Apopatosoma intestinale]